MTSNSLRKKFLDFFKEKGHSIINPASLIPEHDPTVLFTTAGMHPLTPFLMGEKHPSGKRLANIQPCLRTDDMKEVGDICHHTFFEMMGSWSLGDYFKKEAIEFSFEFLTSSKWLGIKKENLAISIFKGDKDAEKDEESREIWLRLGISKERIKELGKKDNWWGPAGETGPCGPDTEMFCWMGKKPAPKEFDPKNKSWVEVWNDVFMEYYKNKDGKYDNLSEKNVDTGMGFERMLAVLNGLDDNYKTDVFFPIIEKIEELSKKKYEDFSKEFRIIADHLKASVFIIGDRMGVEPSNLGQGYVLRRIIRRAIRYGKTLNMQKNFLILLVKEVSEIYKEYYPEIKSKEAEIMTVIQKEEEKFEKALDQGLREFDRLKDKKTLSGKDAFNLYQTFGFPKEITQELCRENNIEFDEKGFEEELNSHQELSRTASAGMFKGGLADEGEKAVEYHTATHLLLAALKKVLGDHVFQRGSNINAERLRFDFSHPKKVTPEEIQKVEDLVNQNIKANLEVDCQEMALEDAKNKGATGIFESKYKEKVKVYGIGEISKEICGGPHVKNTGELGKFKIQKEESCSSGVRRIRAILQND
ncbi:MAG: alanine--tRNA ligase [Candidatus Nealsonbacteria bacterium]